MRTPVKATLTFDLSDLPVVGVSQGIGTVYPNGREKAQPTKGVVDVENGKARVMIYGFVVTADGERNKRFTYDIAIYEQRELESELIEAAVGALAMAS